MPAEHLDFGNAEEQPEFRAVDSCLVTFLNNANLFQLRPDMPMDALRCQLVTFTIAHVAVIQLYTSQNSPLARQKCLDASKLVTQAMERTPMRDWKYIDPLMGVGLVFEF
jgi:hypothetical protein